MKFSVRLSAASILWLLAASTWVFVLSGQAAPARAFQETGQYAETVIGQPDFLSSGFTTTQSGLGNPYKLAFDSSGDMWVADEVNHRVLEFKPPFTDGMNASLVIGQPDFTSNAIRTTQSGTSEDAGVSFDAQGDLWVSDWINNRVLEFKPPFSTGMNASVVLGQPNFTSTQAFSHPPGQFVNPHLANQLAAPVDVAFDSAGDLWLSDRANNRVLEFKPPFSSGMDASLVLGQDNLTAYSYSITPTASSLFGPQGLAFDSQGNLWVSDQNDNRILEFAASSLTTDDPKAVFEIGQPAGPYQFANRTATDSPSGLDGPTVIAFDSSGDLWVVDHLNNRILEFKPPFTEGMSASLEIGQPPGPTAFTGNSLAISQGGFNNPLGLGFDPQGNLWVADQNNNRVLEFSASALVTAGTTIVFPSSTAVAVGNATDEASCNLVGTQSLCHLVIDQAETGVDLDATGAASWNTTNLYSAYLGPQAPEGTSAPPFVASSYYGVYLTGLENGTAKFCFGGRPGATGMAYLAKGEWSTIASSESGSSICATLPLASMEAGQVVVAIQGGTSVSGISSQGTKLFQAGEAVALVLVVVGVGVLVVRRRRAETLPAEETEEDEGLDEWI